MSLRERLEAKRRPALPHELCIDDPTVAEQQVQQALAALGLAQLRQPADGEQPDETAAAALADAQAALEQAQEQLRACYETVQLHALEPGDFEALVAAHPPTTRPDKDEWEGKTFEPASSRCAPPAASSTSSGGWATWAAARSASVSGTRCSAWRWPRISGSAAAASQKDQARRAAS